MNSVKIEFSAGATAQNILVSHYEPVLWDKAAAAKMLQEILGKQSSPAFHKLQSMILGRYENILVIQSQKKYLVLTHR